MSNMKNTKRRKKRGLRYNKKRRAKQRLIILILIAVLIALGVIMMTNQVTNLLWEPDPEIYWEKDAEKIKVERPELDVQLLTINPYSRPGTPTKRIQNIVVHYTANPGTTAQQNRDYFEGLKESQITQSSSNFIIGLEGEIIQCIPSAEVAYASNSANSTSVSIEMCHPDETGAFTENTYESAVKLTAYLCDKFDLDEKDILRHYDITGKNCPKYFVENEDAYNKFLQDVKDMV